MGVHQINSAADFQSALSSNDVVFLDAFAEWCGPCKMISPYVSKWSDEYSGVHFAKFDVDNVPELSMSLGIRAMPTFLVFKGGKKVDEFVGANPAALKRLIEKYAN
jgi:thioredoxin 1